MRKRVELEEHQESALAPYAMRARSSRGRKVREEEAPYRGIYQRDRDRIIHCTAFRRLEYKTQVFINVLEGDHHRNRLTHTMEVTQIARTLARALALNEDLVESLALAHDLGHGPFGHSGETALDEMMRDHGGFNHNVQGLRIVDLLEPRYPDFPGLNLTYETREGYCKIFEAPGSTHEQRAKLGFVSGETLTLEAQLVSHADEIAYDTHDLEDGLVSGALKEEDLCSLALWKQVDREVRSEYAILGSDRRLRWRASVRRLIRTLVSDLLAETERRIAAAGLASLADVRRSHGESVAFGAALDAQKEELEQYLNDHFYYNPAVRKHTGLWQERLKELFAAYRQTPERLPEDHRRRATEAGESLERVICDYVAGMTDRYAEQMWERYCQR